MNETPVIIPEQPDTSIINWQQKLLPWMVIMPTALIGVFIFLATVQMRNFEAKVFSAEKSDVANNLVEMYEKSNPEHATRMDFIKLYTLTKMEEHSIDRRYNQAGTIVMSGIYTKYLGFFTGMILAIVGSVFIISKLKEDTSKLEGSIKEHIKFNVVSSSPGIIFGLLGTILMATTILKRGEVNVQDQPLYLNYYNLSNHNMNADGIGSLDDSTTIISHIDTTKVRNANP
jgi:hypothetical protein